MTLRLNGSTSGYTELDAPASAGNNTLVLPTGNGSSGQVLSTDGAGNLSWVAGGGSIVLETAKSATGTAVDFTGIPSWVKRITVMFSGVSTNGTSRWIVQLGDSGGIETTGYSGHSFALGFTGNSFSDGFGLEVSSATSTCNGHITLTTAGSNTWTCSGSVSRGDTVVATAGAKTLSATLTQIRITTQGGTNSFDAGSLNILYEG